MNEVYLPTVDPALVFQVAGAVIGAFMDNELPPEMILPAIEVQSRKRAPRKSQRKALRIRCGILVSLVMQPFESNMLIRCGGLGRDKDKGVGYIDDAVFRVFASTPIRRKGPIPGQQGEAWDFNHQSIESEILQQIREAQGSASAAQTPSQLH